MIRLEVGKKYITRNGCIVEILHRTHFNCIGAITNSNLFFVFVDEDLRSCNGQWNYTVDGLWTRSSFAVTTPHPLDIVAEYRLKYRKSK